MPTAQGTLRFASCSALRHSTWRRALDKPLPRRVLAAARQRLLRHFNSPSFCRQADPRAMATQCSGQPLDEGDEHGPVRPIQACSWLGSAEHGGLLPQHDELDVLAGGRAAHQEDQSERLTEDQVQPAQRDAGIMSDHRSPLVSDPVPSSGTPQAPSCFADSVDQVPAAAQAARTARVSCGVACSGHGPRNLAAMMTRRSLTAMSSWDGSVFVVYQRARAR